jgi:hypothetical protein
MDTVRAEASSWSPPKSGLPPDIESGEATIAAELPHVVESGALETCRPGGRPGVRNVRARLDQAFSAYAAGAKSR